MTSHRILFDDEDMVFIKEYKDAKGLDIQKFVREAVKEKIKKIQVEEDLLALQRLKK